MTTLCRGCDNPLPDRLVRLGVDVCGPACRDRRVERVIAASMEPVRDLRGRPRSATPRRSASRKRWCAWDGEDLPAGTKGQFCSAECAWAYACDVARSA